MAEPSAEETIARLRPGAGVRPQPHGPIEPAPPVPDSYPDEDKRVSRIQDIPPAQRKCRVRHLWPSEIDDLEPGKPLPRGINVSANEDGSSRVAESCRRNCGKSRVFDTLPGGIIPSEYALGYRQDKRWVTVDPDSGITARTIKRALWSEVLRGRKR